MGEWETDELNTGCGKFLFVCFTITLVFVIIVSFTHSC